MLLLIDNRPLQRAAWAEFHAARKRLEKASGELHRHEEVDMPAYESWLHRTFPTMITKLRQLGEEVFLKGQQVHSVQAMNYLTGRSLKKLWRDLKDREAHPEAYKDDPSEKEGMDQDFVDDDENDPWETLFGENGDGRAKQADTSQKSKQSTSQRDEAETASRASAGPAAQAAKDVYRRLVQRLHPDRGGEWTPARQRLWHQVQQAWATGDVDWLIRLEVEWETANDLLGPSSPLSRLRIAIDELHAARRDIERKLRDYRGSFSWRFTLSEKNRHLLHRRTEENFRHDLRYLQSQLDYLNATIAAWERPRSSRKTKSSREKSPSDRTTRRPQRR